MARKKAKQYTENKGLGKQKQFRKQRGEQKCLNIQKTVIWFSTLHFSYILTVSFIGGGNQRKSLPCRKSQLNIITKLYTVQLSMSEIRTLNFRGDRH
jgi:hypothetical protein